MSDYIIINILNKKFVLYFHFCVHKRHKYVNSINSSLIEIQDSRNSSLVGRKRLFYHLGIAPRLKPEYKHHQTLTNSPGAIHSRT